MEKRTLFTNKTLGIALVVPQVLLIFTFFYWPAGQALYWAFTLERPWGGGNEWVGFGNFAAILGDPVYWNSIVKSMIFAFSATVLAMGVALVMALLVDRELRGFRFYRTILVWPYAIAAPALVDEVGAQERGRPLDIPSRSRVDPYPARGLPVP